MSDIMLRINKDDPIPLPGQTMQIGFVAEDGQRSIIDVRVVSLFAAVDLVAQPEAPAEPEPAEEPPAVRDMPEGTMWFKTMVSTHIFDNVDRDKAICGVPFTSTCKMGSGPITGHMCGRCANFYPTANPWRTSAATE